MGLRRRRLSKSESDEVSSDVSKQSVKPEESKQPVKSDSPKNNVVKSNFTALLLRASKYEYNGIVFNRGVPKKVPIKYLKFFKNNGWFQIVE